MPSLINIPETGILQKTMIPTKVALEALFNLAIDSKLLGSDLVTLLVSDISNGAHVLSRAMVMLRKTDHPVKFEITDLTRDAVEKWLEQTNLNAAIPLSKQERSSKLANMSQVQILRIDTSLGIENPLPQKIRPHLR